MTKALEGVKVVEFSWYAAGPMVCKYLANLGAEVIHVESSSRPDGFRGYPPFRGNQPGINSSACYAQYNDSKYGVTLNLKHPRGIELAKQLVTRAAVVLESFTPGTITRMGLGYDELLKINPNLIMLSTCNQGQTGPHAKQPGFGTQLTSLAGFVETTGWPDRDPVLLYAPYIDFVAGLYGAVAVMASLDYRRRTGKGQYIDISQYENGVQWVTPAILDYQANERIATRQGNRDDYAVPHSSYPCLGDDRWCVIAVHNELEWRKFCEGMGNPDWSKRPEFATMSLRKDNESELDSLIGLWTKKYTADQIMERLQKIGVEAGVVKSGSDLFADPHLQDYVWEEAVHPEIGRHNYQRPPFKMSLTSPKIETAAPCLGQHNEYVFQEVLGLSRETYLELVDQSVFN